MIDRRMQEDVPMFPAYVIRTMAAKNKRLTGVNPSVYGFFNHVEESTGISQAECDPVCRT